MQGESLPPTIIPAIAPGSPLSPYPPTYGRYPHDGRHTSGSSEEFTPTDRLVPTPPMTVTGLRGFAPRIPAFRDSHGFEHLTPRPHYVLGGRPVAPPLYSWRPAYSVTTTVRNGRTTSIEVQGAEAPHIQVLGTIAGR